MSSNQVNLFRFDEAVTFEGYLIAPIGNHFRVFDPEGDLMSKTASSVDEAKSDIVDYETHRAFYDQVEAWLSHGLISGDQAEQMKVDIDAMA